ncbi:MAG: TonB-dependent receptor plug domain-containing protein, partial [Candidatus Anammoxibacter sp.]
MKGYNNHYSSIRFTSFSFLLLVFCLWSSVFSLSFCLQPVNSAEIDGQSPASNSDRAQFSNEPHDVFYLMDEQRVSIASKMKEKVKNAPSIVTVITAKEIEDMGFRTLPEVLRIVPGFDIIKSGAFGEIIPGVRGLRNADNKIKVHIDGHSLNTPYNGESRFFFDDIPLKNVKKIEIIRGPGSALYGSNAFLAVVNIITKDADDIDGIEVTSGFGSFDTQEYSVMFGKTLHDIDITGFVDFYNTNGQSDTIKEDPFFGQPFSITPGDTDDGRKRFDTYLKLSYKDLQFIAKYTNKDTEPFVGSNLVLTDDGTNSFNYVMGELNYKFDIGEQLTVKPRVYYDQYDIEFFPEIFPDGFVIPDVDMDGDIE